MPGWEDIPKFKVAKGRLLADGTLVYGISYEDAGISFEDFLRTAIGYPDYETFINEECLRKETKAGLRVVETFDSKVHTVNYPGVIKPKDQKGTLILGFDFGGKNPAIGIFQMLAGQMHIHEAEKPIKIGQKLDEHGFVVPESRWQPWHDLRFPTICQRLVTDFKSPDSPYYHPPGWNYIVIGDHSGSVENSQGTGLPSEIIQSAFGTSMFSEPFDAQKNKEGLEVLNNCFGQHSLVTVNPKCEQLIKALQEDFHYPDEIGKTEKIKPVKNWAEHIGKMMMYVFWYYYRNEKKPINPVLLKELSRGQFKRMGFGK